ncbi:MAG: DMT family transporter [Pseudomonadota bacterium]
MSGTAAGAPVSRGTVLYFTSILVLLGAGWGITQPLAKIAVSTGYKPFGLIFWQLAIATVVLGVVSVARGKGLPFRRGPMRVYLMIAFIGTLIPNSASYQAVVHLQAGLMSVLLSIIPMMAFPVALLLGLDRFTVPRFLGLLLGLAGVLLIVLPDASLPEPGLVVWVFVALIAPACYAWEGNLVARFGLEGLDPVQALCGASLVGTIIALPLATGTGQFFNPAAEWSRADLAIIASSLIHAVVYTTYVWLVSRAGPTFAIQVSYLVTGSGVFWAMLLLGEGYSPFIWAALGLMLAGMALVQPRPSARELHRTAP